ncbi:MAG TPA: hypothetical protein VHS56_00245, partial [Candidatus Cybelea sp.]|nr:hypothetical protein [Candidatus Cybelea sp.]
PEVSRFRRALADLKGSSPKEGPRSEASKQDEVKAVEAEFRGEEQKAEAPAAELQNGEVPKPQPPAIETAPEPTEGSRPKAEAEAEEPKTQQPVRPPKSALASQNEEIVAAQRLIIEQRKAAEALLREVCQLEQRFKTEASAAQAALDYAAAQEKADAAATLEQQARALVQAATQRRNAAAAERKGAAELAGTSRADAQSAKAAVEELERRLRDAKATAEIKFKEIAQSEALVKECADKESAAAAAEAQSRQRVATCQAAYVAAQKQAQTAKDLAEALKKELPAANGLSGISDVQSLAIKIAQEASALGNASA